MRPVPDAAVLSWLKRNEADLALSAVVVAEIIFGIERIKPAERAPRLERTLKSFKSRLLNPVYAFDELSAIVYGEFCGRNSRLGETVATADGMIAAVALRHNGQLATRNVKHFTHSGLNLINPWTD